MKTNTLFVFALVIGIMVGASHVHATVGGPTYIGSFKYNKADESVYFISSSMSGRGCPPELQKISLVSGQVDKVFSCTQGEALVGSDYQNGESLVMNEILKITNNFKDLSSISLPKNNIEIDLEFVRTETLDTEPEYPIKMHFLAKIFQNGKNIGEFPMTGCNTEQPFTFAGFAIPGFEKKLILLSSTKSDCWEGGYTGESLHVVSGVEGLDRSGTGFYKSEQTPLIPSEHTLVVFETDEITPVVTGLIEDSEVSSLFNGTTILIILIVLIAGLFVGKKYGYRN